MEPWVRDLIAVSPSVPRNIDEASLDSANLCSDIKDRFEFKEPKLVSDNCLDWSMCCHHCPHHCQGDMSGVTRLPLQEISAPLQSLTTPSLESQKQTSAQARFIGGPIIKKMTSHIYTCLASLYNAVMSHVLVMHNKRKASLAIIW